MRLGGYVKTAAMAAGERVDSPLLLLDDAPRSLRVLILLALWRTLRAGRETEGLMSLQSVLTYTLIAEVFAEQIAARTTLVEAFWEGTTIKLLCGLLAPDGGRVRALGIDPVRERVQYVGRIGVVSVNARSCGGTTQWLPAWNGSAWCGISLGRATSACLLWCAICSASMCWRDAASSASSAS